MGRHCTVRREWLSIVLTNSGGWDLVGIGTLWKVDRRHRARPGGYLFDQLGTIDFSEGIFRLWDENLYSAWLQLFGIFQTTQKGKHSERWFNLTSFVYLRMLYWVLMLECWPMTACVLNWDSDKDKRRLLIFHQILRVGLCKLGRYWFPFPFISLSAPPSTYSALVCASCRVLSDRLIKWSVRVCKHINARHDPTPHTTSWIDYHFEQMGYFVDYRNLSELSKLSSFTKISYKYRGWSDFTV